MISRQEIDEASAALDVHPSNVQRDYVHGILLWGLYGHSSLGRRLVLKGGNCFRKGYFPTSRYSRDLDFSVADAISHEELLHELNHICKVAGENCGVIFHPDRTRISDRRVAEGSKSITDARIYFHDFYGVESNIDLAVRMDIIEFDRLHLPVQERNLIHPYSDGANLRVRIRCVKLEELLASKMRCLLQRRHLADLYDLVFATFVNRDVQVNRGEILRTFFDITIFGAHPGVAKGLLLDLPFEGMKRFWREYVASPVGSRFSFEEALANLRSLIEGMIQGPVEQWSPVLFPARIRNPIMACADSFLMVRMGYNGLERLVEPYSMKFKVRKDGRAREYFFGYDITGGSSGRPGIRSFTPDRVEMIEATETPFVPRFEVELRKAGAAEAVERFRSGFGRHRYRAPRGQEYEIECTYCGRRFKRRTYSTRIRPHKDDYGNNCYGRSGYRV